jgi:thioredoxin reductase
MKIEDVIIIGAGPAGIAAGIQLKRQGITPLIFERDEIGGLLRNANLVENYPGFPEGVPGRELVSLFKKQLDSVGLGIKNEEVFSIQYKNNCFYLDASEDTYISRILIIASGTRPKPMPGLKISSEAEKKVIFEIAKIADVKKKKIAIVGAGDTAFDYALNLARNNEVYILNKGDNISCLSLLLERSKESPSISYFDNCRISQIDLGKSAKLKINTKRQRKRQDFVADFLVIAIGREPQLGFLPAALRKKTENLKKRGLLYILGDVGSGMYRQTAIATGDAVKAAMIIGEKLRQMGR